MPWDKAQEWERAWWGTCQNTLGEEIKQITYARCMGLTAHHDGKAPYNYDLQGVSVLDIGGGPSSLLLKCANAERMVLMDPLHVPEWVLARYRVAGIEYWQRPAEELEAIGLFDEVWIYNVLQHVMNPERVIHNAQRAGGIIRVFEWIETAVNEGHPHAFSEAQLNGWLRGEGKVEILRENGCVGKAYYGVFVA